MPLNIDQFKSSFKDSLPTSHYEMTIAPPGGNGDQLRFRTESIMLPGTAFFSVDNYSPYGNGLTFQIPYRYTPQEISVVHTVDDSAAIYELFRNWSSKIVDLEGQNKFGAYYFDDYTSQATIEVYNRKLELASKITLLDVFPITVDPVNMSWGQNDEIAKLSVSYRFTRYNVEAS